MIYTPVLVCKISVSCLDFAESQRPLIENSYEEFSRF